MFYHCATQTIKERHSRYPLKLFIVPWQVSYLLQSTCVTCSKNKQRQKSRSRQPVDQCSYIKWLLQQCMWLHVFTNIGLQRIPKFKKNRFVTTVLYWLSVYFVWFVQYNHHCKKLSPEHTPLHFTTTMKGRHLLHVWCEATVTCSLLGDRLCYMRLWQTDGQTRCHNIYQAVPCLVVVKHCWYLVEW